MIKNVFKVTKGHLIEKLADCFRQLKEEGVESVLLGLQTREANYGHIVYAKAIDDSINVYDAQENREWTEHAKELESTVSIDIFAIEPDDQLTEYLSPFLKCNCYNVTKMLPRRECSQNGA